MQDDRIRELLKKVSLELRQSRQDLATVEHRRREPIAIVGIGCRFPGGADSPDSFWQLLAGERDAIGEFPADRGWDPGTLFDPDQGPGTSATRHGGFLGGIADFDAGLFGLSPREALASDPQHRLLLETTWQAFEHAGIDPTGVRGSRTGVFIGTNGNDYPTTLSGYPPELEGYLAVGNAASVASGRISYTFGVEGPALTVDTACSSSLVAAHLAVRSLRDRECDSAVIGGVTLMSSSTLFVEFSRQHGLAPDGRCKAFGDGANGTGWAEGAGVLIAERLSDALANGRRVLAVIRGSAVNQDGASNGLTAPNGPAQQRVIEDALAAAGLRPADVDAVEAHGTGTVLGDPIEAHALMATYGRRRTGDPLWLGSVKSNIGHTQAAAGIAGLIKMVLALRHETLPRTLHAEDPSSKIDWDAGQVRILDTARPWPRHEKVRRAGISAFGVSGTNAHLIVEEAPAPEPGPPAIPAADPDVAETTAWLLSANSPAALAGQADRLRAAVAAPDGPAVAEVTAALRHRALLNQRAVVVGSGRTDLLRALEALAHGGADEDLVRGVAATGRRVVFVFPGQGSQWAGMADSLLRTSPEFAGHIAECADALAPFVDWSLADVLAGSPDAPSLDRVDVVQPVLWAMMVSLARLWIGLGVRPDAVIGHSQGEIAAAHIAGALSLGDAARAVALRSKAITALSGRGAMLTVALPQDRARARLARWEGVLALAAINGPAAVLISGDSAAVDELAAELDGDDIWNRRVNVDYASHSHHVDAIEAQVLAGLAPITARAATVPLISTVNGEPIDTTVMDARYWFDNLRSPVQFERSLRRALTDGYDTVVEVSAHPVLRHTIDAIAESAEIAEVISTGTLRRDRCGRGELLLAAARLYVHGIAVDWQALLPSAAARWIDLPTYAFDRQRFWGADECTTGVADARRLGVRPAGHPLLAGAVEISASDATLFVGQLSLADHPWLADHAVGDTVIVPGAACVDIALWIGAELGWPTLSELVNERPIVIGESGRIRIQVHLGPEHDGARAITFYRADGDDESGADWQQCATGVLTADVISPPRIDTGPVGGSADPAVVYRELGELGLNYGPAFRGLREVSAVGDLIGATADLPESAGAATDFSIHPALLDAALHALPYTGGELALPFSWSGVRLWARDARELSVRVTRLGTHEFGVVGVDAHGEPVVSIDSLTLRPTGNEMVTTSAAAAYRVGWAELSGAGAENLSVALWTADPQVRRAGDIACATDLGELSGADLVVVDTTEFGTGDGSGEVLADLHTVTENTLERIRSWLADGSPRARLVILTRRAYAVADGEVPDLRAAAVPGLVRSARTENPGRIVLVDHDGSADYPALVAVAAAAVAADESEVAVRAGGPAVVPRLGPAPAGPEEIAAQRDSTLPGESSPPDGVGVAAAETAIVIGGLGLLGRLTARTLARQSPVSTVVLVSRRGPVDEQATTARRELESAGLDVEIVACDATDRTQLAAVFAAVPAHRPVTTVVHAAGILADRPVHNLSAAALHEVLRGKADIAWHLHELTAGLNLRAFILFSSAAGTLGIAGQSNYAAANTVLDALAQYRRGQGLPATSLAWGLWETASAMTGHLGGADRKRLARQGVRPITLDAGAGLLARGLRAGAVDLVPVDLVTGRWQDGMSPILRGVLRYRPQLRRATTGDEVRSSGLGALAERDRLDAVRAIVREQAAAVLGYDGVDAITATATFKELGMDSLTAVELRNRLAGALGVRLAATVVFDHPTPAALAAKISADLAGTEPAPQRAAAPVAAMHEPIAIVGMGCRYPGGVRSAQELWELVAAGVDAIGPWPGDRGWEVDDTRAGAAVRSGGFVSDIADFDAGLFGMSPREALATDPQQRQLLEVSWEALEGAGIDPLSLRGSNTGVYTGIMYNDYATRLESIPEDLEAYLTNGSAASVASGRVAYTFGLEGPAVSVDTACSSSLVSIHLAVSALRGGECDLALAGGVTLLSSPASIVSAARLGALSPDGRCRSFGSGADGTGWAEGVGVVVLQRLSDAQKSGRPILAVIRSTAINQDGASNGLTAPSGAAQQRVVRRALAAAGLEPGDVDAVEAHGTGTALGDPIEANALLETYGRPGREHPLYVGSLKSNIGHSQAAAGVGGVIKMVQALRQGVLPVSLHADVPSEHVDWSAGSVRVLSEAQVWPDSGRPRRVGVSAFGVSGTNAHLILEQAPVVEAGAAEPATVAVPGAVTDGAVPVSPLAWLVSANSAAALRRQARRLATHVRARPDIDIAAAAVTLATGRARLAHRAVVIGRDAGEFADHLEAFADDRPAETTVAGTAQPRQRVAFVYPGHGSQWAGMATNLLDTAPVFAAAVQRCAEALAPHLDWDVAELLRSGAGTVAGRTNVEVDQPALWTVMMGLTALWESAGITPDVVIGHSQGEVAAACGAGALSLAEGARIVAVRSKLLARLVGRGAMASLALPRERARELLREVNGVDIATVNGTAAVVVSGESDGIDRLIAACVADDIRARRLDAELAGHSPVIDAVAADLLAELGEVHRESATARMISTVTGAPVSADELDAGYWYRNLRETVQFHTAAEAAIDSGCDVFVEVSPHPVLAGPLATTIENSASPEGLATATLRRDEGNLSRFLQSAAELEAGGVTVDWSALTPSAAPIPLPSYDFERRRYWLDGSVALPEVASATGDDHAGEDETHGATLAALPEWQRLGAVRELVQTQIRTVLRLDPADELAVESPLKELGFESVSAVDLTTRLSRVTGLRLPTTLAFEYPSPEAIAAHICTLFDTTGQPDIEGLVDRLEAALRDGATDATALVRLRTVLASAGPSGHLDPGDDLGPEIDLEQASDDELFDIVDVGRNS